MITPGVALPARAENAAAPAITAVDAPAQQTPPTIWGLEPLQLHDRFWASRGMQVVRPGEADVAEHALFYLLMEPRALAIFDPAAAEESLGNTASGEEHLIYIRVHDTRERGPLERGEGDACQARAIPASRVIAARARCVRGRS